MNNNFNRINAEEISGNAIKMIGKEWMLITAGNINSFNTMTAAWGGLGFLWNLPVSYIFIRPQRYTYEFVEKNDYFTLSFFDKKYQEILKYCGTKSGKNVEKIKETGLIPVETDKGNIFFQQASLVIECKKIYFEDIDPKKFLLPKIQNSYPLKDYHRMYIGEIVECYLNKEK